MLHCHDVPELHTKRSAISHSQLPTPELRNKYGAHAVLHRLMQKAAMRLCTLQCIEGQLYARIKLMDRCKNTNRWRQNIVLVPAIDTRLLLSALDRASLNY
jgi:DNA polymerase-4